MRGANDVRKDFHNLWINFTSVLELRNHVSAQSGDAVAGTIEVQLRSLVWKVLLWFKTVDQVVWREKLRDSRAAFDSLRDKFMKPLQNPSELGSFGDPLSDDKSSPWISLREDESLMHEISMDVERCMPNNYYFQQPETQKTLLEILFIWHRLNEDVGYRQGMHEILAPVLWVIERDAIENPNGSDSIVDNIFNERYIGHDTFTVFGLIMENLKVLYAPDRPLVNNSKTQQAPIVSRCNRIMQRYLPKCDPELAAHLTNIEIIPQVFLMRWLRLLFGREFPFDQVLVLWDGLFCQENPLVCVDFVCVSMLLRIRWELLDADYNTALTLLLRYPKVSDEYPPFTLVQDSIHLQEHLDSGGGAHIIEKHSGRAPKSYAPANLLPVESPKAPGRLSSHSRSASSVDESSGKRAAIGFENLLQDAARGIYSRGERWGLNKAVRDAVGEVRKNVQHLHAVGSHTPQFHARISSALSGESTKSEDDSNDVSAPAERRDEDRNKTLAKMLDGAIEELWNRQKDVANEKSPEDEQVKSLTTAIAKVQFVKIYLEDSSLPLPIEETTHESIPAPPTQDTSTIHKKRDEKDDAKMANDPGDESRPSSVMPLGTKVATPASGLQQQSSATTEQGAIMTAVGEDGDTSKPPAKHRTRPSLAESTFSWMLDREESAEASARSTFVASAPFTDRPRDYRRKAAFLFGEADGDADQPNIRDQHSATNEGPKTTDEGENFSGFKMNTLKKR